MDRDQIIFFAALTSSTAAEKEGAASKDAGGQDRGEGGGASEPEWWNAGWYAQEGVNKENRSWGNAPGVRSEERRNVGSSGQRRNLRESTESKHDLERETLAESKPQRNWKIRVGPPKKPNGKPWVSMSAFFPLLLHSPCPVDLVL